MLASWKENWFAQIPKPKYEQQWHLLFSAGPYKKKNNLLHSNFCLYFSRELAIIISVLLCNHPSDVIENLQYLQKTLFPHFILHHFS